MKRKRTRKPKYRPGDGVYFVYPNELQLGKIIRAFDFTNAVAPDVPVYEIATAQGSIVLNEDCLSESPEKIEQEYREKLEKVVYEFEASVREMDIVQFTDAYWKAVDKQVKAARKREAYREIRTIKGLLYLAEERGFKADMASNAARIIYESVKENYARERGRV